MIDYQGWENNVLIFIGYLKDDNWHTKTGWGIIWLTVIFSPNIVGKLLIGRNMYSFFEQIYLWPVLIYKNRKCDKIGNWSV